MSNQKQKILPKISKLLNSEVDTEAKIVYLFVEIRKILDLKEFQSECLNTFCNWVLHVKLTYQSTIQYFENKFIESIRESSTSKEAGERIKKDQEDFLNLEELKGEVNKFLEHYELSPQLVINEKWIQFMKLLFEVLEECPIIINGSFVKKLSVTKDSNNNNTYRFLLVERFSDNRNVIKIKIKF